MDEDNLPSHRGRLVKARRTGYVMKVAWVKSKHMYLIRGSVGTYALFLPIRRRKKNKNKIKQKIELRGLRLSRVPRLLCDIIILKMSAVR